MFDTARNLESKFLVYRPEVQLLAATKITNWPEWAQGPGQGQGTEMERVTELAGRVCYDSWGRGRGSSEYHAHIMEAAHGSVTEHASMTFIIAGVSRALTHELIRHRVGTAISQRSTRYVDEAEGRVVVPPPFIIQEGDEPRDADWKRSLQERLLTAHSRACSLYTETFEAARVAGIDLKTARGAARAHLLTNHETELVWSCNVRALYNILAQRDTVFADAEIRRLFADYILPFASNLAPAYFRDGEINGRWGSL